MNHLDSLLRELEAVDASLTATPLGEFDGLATVLAKRAALLEDASQAIDTLLHATPEQRSALQRSHQTGSQVLRQLILARHMLATEVGQLNQEQRLWGTIAGQTPSPPSRVNLQG